MRIAVYVDEHDVVIRAEVYDEAQKSPIGDTSGLRVRSVSENVITDSAGNRVDVQTFLANPSSFVCGDDGLVKQVLSGASTTVIQNLDMSVPFSFARANTIESHGLL
nr:MAG TPA: hypothetical protein [Bacteriophage sp.]